MYIYIYIYIYTYSLWNCSFLIFHHILNRAFESGQFMYIYLPTISQTDDPIVVMMISILLLCTTIFYVIVLDRVMIFKNVMISWFVVSYIYIHLPKNVLVVIPELWFPLPGNHHQGRIESLRIHVLHEKGEAPKSYPEKNSVRRNSWIHREWY